MKWFNLLVYVTGTVLMFAGMVLVVLALMWFLADTLAEHAQGQNRPAPRSGQPQEGGKVSPDGTEEITIDLPESEKKRNVGGRDGAGLCVFTSIEYAARWQNERSLVDFQKFMKEERGGGYPTKVQKMIDKYAPGTPFLQYEGQDPSILKAALRSGRLPCVTYNGHDVHYNGSISHMVTLAHLSDTWACIGDNNFTKDNQYVWMSPAAFLQRWGSDGGWCVILLKPSPSPIPHNRKVVLSADWFGKEKICDCLSLLP